jgi:hypothetical protein
MNTPRKYRISLESKITRKNFDTIEAGETKQEVKQRISHTKLQTSDARSFLNNLPIKYEIETSK